MKQMQLRTSSLTPTHYFHFSSGGGNMFSSPSPSFFLDPSTAYALSSAPIDLVNVFAHMDIGEGLSLNIALEKCRLVQLVMFSVL